MSWIQNFLHFFIKEVEVEIEIEEDLHKEAVSHHPHTGVKGKERSLFKEKEAVKASLSSLREGAVGNETFFRLRESETGKDFFHRIAISESGKDINARITYQYPKGRFHSLSIQREPEQPGQKQRGNRNKRTAPKNIPVKQKMTEKEPEPHQTKAAAAFKAKQKQVPKTGKTHDYKIKGPFQPTEIPSPVFGFNRPNASVKEPEVIEHELSHFIKEEMRESGITRSLSGEHQIETSPAQVSREPVLAAVFPAVLLPDLPEEEMNRFPESESPVAVSENAPYIQSEETAPSEETSVSAETSTLNRENFLMAEEEMESAEPAVAEESENSGPKRPHLPFNVMMLKRDRQKWEENKQKRAEQQKPNVPSLFQQIANMGGPIRESAGQESQPKPQPALKSEDPDNDVMSYQFPVSSLLHPPVMETGDSGWIEQQTVLLDQTLQNFNVGARVVNVTQGPSVTRFEVQPEPGVKVNKITNLTDDIKLSLAARDIRMEAPIPGKHTIGIEVPNQKSRPVLINEIIESDVFHDSASPLTAVLGLDISGKPIVTDLKKMPHGLIAGATGSGKSVCINSILVSLLYKARPQDLKLLLIDPKMVELAPYNRIPHLVSPVITDVKAATAALKWAVEEMERRYELFAHTGVRDINRFNELAMEHKHYSDKLPFIVIIIDELADLMMMSPADVEEAICRIAQKARACGIHLIVATQRPSVDVITGLIKANIPTRIAFSVSSQVDSRTIIDISGAEKLLGRGDMLFLENGSSKPVRLQGTFVSDEEIDLVVGHVREQQEPEYLFQQDELLKKVQVTEEEDELFYEACEFIIDQGGASTSSLQRRFKIGYNRAARLMDLLESQGYISSSKGSRPREVLITEADLESMQESV